MPRVTLISAVRAFLDRWENGEADEVGPAVRDLAEAYEANRHSQNERQRRRYNRSREEVRRVR